MVMGWSVEDNRVAGRPRCQPANIVAAKCCCASDRDCLDRFIDRHTHVANSDSDTERDRGRVARSGVAVGCQRHSGLARGPQTSQGGRQRSPHPRSRIRLRRTGHRIPHAAGTVAGNRRTACTAANRRSRCRPRPIPRTRTRRSRSHPRFICNDRCTQRDRNQSRLNQSPRIVNDTMANDGERWRTVLKSLPGTTGFLPSVR
jgi:hypothetical protein